MVKKLKTIYTTPQLAELLNIPMRKILSYIERGYIVPSIEDAKGHGSKRRWSAWDAVKIYIIRECEKMGITVDRIRYVCKHLTQNTLKNTPRLIMNIHGDFLPTNTSIDELDTLTDLDPDPSILIVIPIRAIKIKVFELIDNRE